MKHRIYLILLTAGILLLGSAGSESRAGARVDRDR